MLPNPSRQCGFTLVELMLVVALLSIITMVGIPSFTELFRQTELQRAASNFINAMRYAQQRAVMQRTPVRLVINVDERRFYVPVEKEEERKRYRSRSLSRRNTRSSGRGRDRVELVNEINDKLPPGFIFEFVYQVAPDEEIKRGEGEIVFYPDGSADAAYVTLLRLADSKEGERRVFIKTSPATGMITSMEGHTQDDGDAFYRGFYDDPRYAS